MMVEGRLGLIVGELCRDLEQEYVKQCQPVVNLIYHVFLLQIGRLAKQPTHYTL